MKEHEEHDERRPSPGITKHDLRELKESILHRLENLERKLMITEQELVDGLTALPVQLNKIAAEQTARFDVLTAKVAELKAVIAAGGTIGQAVQDAFTGVQTAVNDLDALIPDAVTAKK